MLRSGEDGLGFILGGGIFLLEVKVAVYYEVSILADMNADLAIIHG